MHQGFIFVPKPSESPKVKFCLSRHQAKVLKLALATYFYDRGNQKIKEPLCEKLLYLLYHSGIYLATSIITQRFHLLLSL